MAPENDTPAEESTEETPATATVPSFGLLFQPPAPVAAPPRRTPDAEPEAGDEQDDSSDTGDDRADGSQGDEDQQGEGGRGRRRRRGGRGRNRSSDGANDSGDDSGSDGGQGSGSGQDSQTKDSPAKDSGGSDSGDGQDEDDQDGDGQSSGTSRRRRRRRRGGGGGNGGGGQDDPPGTVTKVREGRRSRPLHDSQNATSARRLRFGVDPLNRSISAPHRTQSRTRSRPAPYFAHSTWHLLEQCARRPDPFSTSAPQTTQTHSVAHSVRSERRGSPWVK